jgi:hypothetical protein
MWLYQFYSSHYLTSGISALFLMFPLLGFCAGEHMTTTMKYNFPLLDFDTQFSLWQVKMWAVLLHHDLDEAIEGFRSK